MKRFNFQFLNFNFHSIFNNQFSKLIVITLFLLTSNFYLLTPIYAGPQSTTYELKQWGFGAGGEASTSSTTYSLFGTAGESDMATAESTTYRANPGLVYTLQAAVPLAPSFTNPGSNYDRLKIVINTGNNPTDTQYAIAITSNYWQTTNYVKSTYTVGSTLSSADWLTYADWGGAGGFYVTNLSPSTTYMIKTKARQGNFTETPWGPSMTAVTVNPSLTFGVDAASITFNRLNAGNSYTDSSKSTVLTTSTNAYNGYIVYGYDTNALNTTNIPNYSSLNSAPTAWSGTGFGYTTNCSNLAGGTADRFTNGGPKYAGFGTGAPGDPVASHLGPVLTPISSEQFQISYRVTAAANTPAGTYNTTVLYIVVPTY